MAIKNYQVTIKGVSPLLMHWDNIDHSDELKEWRKEPDNKKASVAGDDRYPSWTWIGSMYHDGARVCIPSENIQRMCMEGGAMVSVTGGKKTFKSQSQSGMAPVEAFWPITVRGREIPLDEVMALRDVPEFGLHKAKVRDLGFSLFVRRAKVGMSKHVRVRPRFDEWQARGIIRVWDDQITLPVLRNILRNGGAYKGLGDWRPGSKTPGRFGMFESTVTED